MPTATEFLPAAPGTFANGVDRKTGAVTHHIVLGFQKGAPVLYPPLAKDAAALIAVGHHTLYIPELGREASDIMHAKRLLGAPE